MNIPNPPPITPKMVGIGAVFIDDIVRADGRTYMGQLGGGVVHALMGAAVWDERPGICAVIGRNLPEAAFDRLQYYFDISGLIKLDIPQIRAWQLFEENGLRRELYRVTEVAPFITGAKPEHFPDQYINSEAFYLLQNFDGLRAWCSRLNGIVLWEPLQQIMIPGNRELFVSALRDCMPNIVSPNLAEARGIYGELNAEDILTRLLEDGAQIAAIRMGEQGSLVGCRKTGKRYHIPTVKTVHLIDQTGAGNTYCGALLWGILQGKSLMESAAAGAVAASFCLEQVGTLNPAEVNPKERDKRYLQIKKDLVD